MAERANARPIAWIGIGKIGLPMATHLLGGGMQVTGFDPVRASVDALAARGARAAASAAAAASGAQVVFSSLPDDHALLDVAFAEDGALAGCAPGTLFVETSTVSPQASARVAEAASARGVRYLRVTVSGNYHFAERAQLTVLASGERADYEEALPLLRLFGPKQFYLGTGEQARTMKLVINLMVAGTSALLAEALALGRRGEIDWALMLDTLAASAVASPLVASMAERLKARDFAPTFTAHQLAKDLGLILQAAAALGVPMPLSALVAQGNLAVIAAGEGAQDYVAVVRHVERLAGLDAPAVPGDAGSALR